MLNSNLDTWKKRCSIVLWIGIFIGVIYNVVTWYNLYTSLQVQ